MGDRLVVVFFLSARSLTPRREALPLHKLYACASSNCLSDVSETTSQYCRHLVLKIRMDVYQEEEDEGKVEAKDAKLRAKVDQEQEPDRLSPGGQLLFPIDV